MLPKSQSIDAVERAPLVSLGFIVREAVRDILFGERGIALINSVAFATGGRVIKGELLAEAFERSYEDYSVDSNVGYYIISVNQVARFPCQKVLQGGQRYSFCWLRELLFGANTSLHNDVKWRFQTGAVADMHLVDSL